MSPRTASRRNLRFQVLEDRFALSATPLISGQEVFREVGQEDPFDEFFFDGQVGDLVWLSVGEERAETGNTVQLTVEDPSGNSSFFFDSNNAFTFFEVSESGRYRVFVSERGNERDFDYRLRFITRTDEPLARGDLDVTLTPGQRHSGTLGFGQLSVVQFEAESGASVFTTLGETGGVGGPRLWITDPEGELVVNTSDNDAIASSFTARVSGTFTAIIGENGGDSFLPFTFSTAAFPGVIDPDLPGNRFLASGERFTDSLGVGEQHFVQFEASAGDRVYASLGEQFVATGTPVVRIIDPNGRVVPGTFESDNDGLQVAFDAFASGVFTAVISESGSDSSLSYTFTLAVLPRTVDFDLPQNTFLSSGERHTATLGVGEQDLVQFEVAAGSRVYASLGEQSPATGTPLIRVVDPNGRVVPGTFQSDNDGLQIAFDALEGGLYTAVISESGSDSPLSYVFTLAALPGAVDFSLPQNTLLRSGERHTATVGIGQQDVIQFQAIAGSRVYASLGEQTPATGTPLVRVVDPNGRVVDGTFRSDNDGLQFDFRALETGLYSAVINESGSDSQLSYRFRVALSNPQLNIGSPLEPFLEDGEITQGFVPVGDFFIFPFFLAEGATADFVLDEQSPATGSPRLQIVNSFGQEFWDGFDNDTETASITPGPSGIFYAVVSDSGTDSPLAFNFTATGISLPPDATPGDFDGDMDVDINDFLGWSSSFGATGNPGFPGDFNRDSVVSAADYVVFRDNVTTASVLGLTSVSALPSDGDVLDLPTSATQPLALSLISLQVASTLSKDIRGERESQQPEVGPEQLLLLAADRIRQEAVSSTDSQLAVFDLALEDSGDEYTSAQMDEYDWTNLLDDDLWFDQL